MAAWHELEGELELEDELEQALSPLYEWNELSAETVQFNPFVICAGKPFRVLDAFRFDSSKLRHDRARDHLADIKAITSQIILSQRSARPVTLVCVNGHTDPVGSDAYNERLGQRRANAVAKALSDMLKQHDPSLLSRVRIVPQSLGEAQPIPGGAEKNRRVEVFLSASPRPSPSSGFPACVADCVRNAEMRLGRPLGREELWRLQRRCQRECRGIPA